MTINFRQLSILVFLSFISMKFLALPSLLFTVSGNMSFLVAFVLMVIDGIYAFLIISIMQKNGSKNLYEFLSDCFNKVIAKIILFALMLEMALLLADLSKGLEFFVLENLYDEFNWVAFILPLVLLTGYMISKGMRDIARVSEICYWSVIVGIIYIALKSTRGLELGSFLPLFHDGVKPLFDAAFIYSLWFGSSTFLLLLFGKVDFKNKRKRVLFIYVLLAILLVQFVYIVFLGLFGDTSPTHNFALSDVSQYSSGKSSIDELSWLIVALWIVTQSIQLAVYGYCLKESVKQLFNIKNENIIIILTMLYLFLWSLIGKEVVRIEEIFYSPFTSAFALSVEYILPILIFASFLIKILINKKLANKIKENSKKIKNFKIFNQKSKNFAKNHEKFEKNLFFSENLNKINDENDDRNNLKNEILIGESEFSKINDNKINTIKIKYRGENEKIEISF